MNDHSQAIATLRRLCSPPPKPIPTGVSPRLAPLRGIRAVLFDVYGTLFVSGSGDVGARQETTRADALLAALHATGAAGDLEEAAPVGAELFVEEIERTHQELRSTGTDYPEVDIVAVWDAVLEALSTRGLVRRPPESAVLALDYECRVNPVGPMPGVEDCLRSLRRAGCGMGIVSNAQFFTPLLFPAFLDATITELGFENEASVWSFEQREAKPSTALFAKALQGAQRVFGAVASECLFVGNDMLNDIAAAQPSGLQTALFAGDRRSLRWREDDERVSGVEPDCVLTELSQLLEVVG